MTPRFLQVVVQAKSEPDNDWRAFLHWADPEEMMVYEIRGYGDSACAAMTDAQQKFADDPFDNASDYWEWK